MKKLRPPNGARRGLRKVKCDDHDLGGCSGDGRLFHMRIHQRGGLAAAEHIMCERHCIAIETSVKAVADYYEMEWWELEEHEYETSA